MTEQHHLEFGASRINYDLTYAQRKTLEISVHPDLRVSVVAPEGALIDDIKAKVKKRAGWILKQQREFELYLPHVPPRKYVSGETHRYLGRQYRLKVHQAEQQSVKLTRGYLKVEVGNVNPKAVQTLVDGWYRKQAHRVLPERLEEMLPRFNRLGIAKPQLVIRKMEKRWGSCTEAGVITLNLRLMQVPKSCIDYVIVHELCHLVEHNHSQRFYQLLDRMMPEWSKQRRKLNEVVDTP